jgi:hypothetical protein
MQRMRKQKSFKAGIAPFLELEQNVFLALN